MGGVVVCLLWAHLRGIYTVGGADASRTRTRVCVLRTSNGTNVRELMTVEQPTKKKQ